MSQVQQDLKSIVEKHTVRYEAWPHWEMHETRRVMVGFDLELHGTHDHGHSQLTPGCESAGRPTRISGRSPKKSCPRKNVRLPMKCSHSTTGFIRKAMDRAKWS